jgi:hypothetical protein
MEIWRKMEKEIWREIERVGDRDNRGRDIRVSVCLEEYVFLPQYIGGTTVHFLNRQCRPNLQNKYSNN